MSDPYAQRDLSRRLEQTQVIERPRTNYGPTKPSSWPISVPFFDTTAGFWVFWDGARWLTVHEYDVVVSYLATFSGTPVASPVSALRTDYAPWIMRVVILTSVTPNNAGNFWTVTLQGLDISGASSTNIYQINTGATPDTAGVRTNHEVAFAGASPANRALLRVLMTATGAPGVLELTATAFYRLVVT